MHVFSVVFSEADQGGTPVCRLGDVLFAEEPEAVATALKFRDDGYHAVVHRREVIGAPAGPTPASSPLNALDPAILIDSLRSMDEPQRREFFLVCMQAGAEATATMTFSASDYGGAPRCGDGATSSTLFHERS